MKHIEMTSYNPATNEPVWKGTQANKEEVEHAIALARQSFEGWSRLNLDERLKYLYAYKQRLQEKQKELAEAISIETGKPLWETMAEVKSMIDKVDLSLESYKERCPTKERLTSGGAVSVTRHKPHGVIAVLGPYNFPGHLPNGHIVPALLAGNTIVFKPSEYTPRVGEFIAQLWNEAGLPKGVLNLVQGGRMTGQELAYHPAINGLFFTGSWPTGKQLRQHFSPNPEKILALEMGGNNPLVITSVKDKKTAAYIALVSAYITAGQRCTCARRLIVTKEAEPIVDLLQEMIKGIRIGAYTDKPEPFMGPIITVKAAEKILLEQEERKNHGAIPLVEMKQLHPHSSFLSPGLMDCTPLAQQIDEEIFGPFLQVIRVADFSAAIEEANKTQYGLVAGLLSDRREEFELFLQRTNAGVINWNTTTTGASSGAPFGGIKKSGNHRPSAFYAADYCSYPVASLENETIKIPETPFTGLEGVWKQ